MGGHKWGSLGGRRGSKASRLIQMADLVAYWIFRYYQSKDDRGFRMIEPSILRRANQRVGLVASVTPATEAALAAIVPHKYPFPKPTVELEGPGQFKDEN